MRLLQRDATVPTGDGQIAFQSFGDLPAELPLVDVRPLGLEQSNSSLVIDEALFVKVYRRIEAGENPDLELTRFLVSHEFAHVPALYGWWSYFGTPPGCHSRHGSEVHARVSRRVVARARGARRPAR